MKSFPSDVLESIKTHLQDERKLVVKRIHELEAQDPFTDTERITDNAASDAEASEESSHDRFIALTDELKEKLVEIDAALKRIANGTYGFCANCGNMIDTDRLAILPTANFCRACEGKKRN